MATPPPPRTRVAMRITGVVQGVGFRPFVHAQATARGLAGWVRNDGGGVELEIEGGTSAVTGFVAALRAENPPSSRIDTVHLLERPRPGAEEVGPGFRILESRVEADAGARARRSRPPTRPPAPPAPPRSGPAAGVAPATPSPPAPAAARATR